MRTITKKFASLSGNTETLALDLKVQEHSSQTWEFLGTGGGNVQVKLKSVFTDESGTELTGGVFGAGDVAGADIQTIPLTNDTLSIVNFDMKLGHVRCTYDASTSTMSGDLWIKVTTSK